MCCELLVQLCTVCPPTRKCENFGNSFASVLPFSRCAYAASSVIWLRVVYWKRPSLIQMQNNIPVLANYL